MYKSTSLVDFSLGADPEVFLQNKAGKFISSVGLFGGTKRNPKAVGDGFSIQEDNVTLEFNIPPTSMYNFARSISRGCRLLTQCAMPLNLNVVYKASAVFDEDQLQTPQASEFGCEADFNVWKLQPNPRPKATNKNLRTCGGHVHIGADIAINDPVGLGRILDLFLGCPSISMDEDKHRRELYGKAGAIRRKPYGLEYRVLSNFWLLDYSDWVAETVDKAFSFYQENTAPFFSKDQSKLIIACINHGDKDILRTLTKQYGLEY